MLESSSEERVAIEKTFEIKEFIHQHNISDRESDVFLLLSNGITTTNEISEQLGLSPNTISNHLNSLLAKTQTKNKSELLAKFLRMHATKLGEMKLLSRRPRLMVISKDVELCKTIKDELSARGFQVFVAESIATAPNSICGMRLDFLLVDESSNHGKGIDFIRNLKTYHQSCLAFGVLSHDDTHSLTLAREMIECLRHPIDVNNLAFMVLESSIERPVHKNRFLRVNVGNLQAQVNQTRTFEVANIGFDGFCLVVPREVLLKDKTFRKMKNISFRLPLPGAMTLEGEAEVCWVRKKDQIGMRSGIGVKFLNLPLELQAPLRQFVRDKKYVSLQHVL